jgi:hypothetical protein
MTIGHKTGGRQKGTPNKATQYIETRLAELGCDPLANLVAIANDPATPITARIRVNHILLQFHLKYLAAPHTAEEPAEAPAQTPQDVPPQPQPVFPATPERPVTPADIEAGLRAGRAARAAALAEKARQKALAAAADASILRKIEAGPQERPMPNRNPPPQTLSPTRA